MTAWFSLSAKLSLDSGFSDSSESGTRAAKEDGGRKLKSAVVHETHALTNSSKMHHVSKVYFYSVSDILQDSSTDQSFVDPSAPSTPRISAPASELTTLTCW